MVQESCEYKKGRAIKLRQRPEVVTLKPDDRPGVESDYIRDGNLTLTVGIGPSFLMKKKVIDKTPTCCLHSFSINWTDFRVKDLLL